MNTVHLWKARTCFVTYVYREKNATLMRTKFNKYSKPFLRVRVVFFIIFELKGLLRVIRVLGVLDEIYSSVRLFPCQNTVKLNRHFSHLFQNNLHPREF